VGAEDFVAARLKQVSRSTLVKELCQLSRLAKWAYRRGHLASMPVIDVPDKRKLGTPVDGSRKREFQVFNAGEIECVLRHLPETSRSRKVRGKRYPVWARFVVAWETGLRPETIDQLRAPDDYRPGADELTIRAEADKNRYARSLPLSPAARAALDSVCPQTGLIFGSHDYRHVLRTAAKAAGVDALRAKRLSDYDFRHSRLTHLGQVSENVVGIMYIAGHTQLATTSRYVTPPKHAALDVLAKAAAALGPRNANPHGCEPLAPRPTQGAVMTPFRGVASVRRRQRAASNDQFRLHAAKTLPPWRAPSIVCSWRPLSPGFDSAIARASAPH
jgi:integrase